MRRLNATMTGVVLAVASTRRIGFLGPAGGRMNSQQGISPADHGGGIDEAAVRYGGTRADWLDLSTGINPVPYPVPALGGDVWTALPDAGATREAEGAARAFWRVPPGAAVLAVPGASAAIARLPALRPAGVVTIPGPTYNEHARAFAAQGWRVSGSGPAMARVVVHPNNPDGRRWSPEAASDGLAEAGMAVIDESFCDVMPGASLIALADRAGVVVLKSFGKFWGLAGLRLGFAIGDPALIAALSQALGPWPVSGPALAVAALALRDEVWAAAARARLARDAARLDSLTGWTVAGGTDLFRLYDVGDAHAMRDRLARARIWTRAFPWSDRLLRLGLPGPDGWSRLEAAL